jgi:pimeloyl-ACP methyl ester carboxylesterase
MTSGLRAFCEKLGLPAEAAANPADIEQALLDKMWQAISGDRKLRWTIVQRGFWVNGAKDLREFLRSITSFTLDGRAELIRCPTLITHAEDDPLAASAQDLFDALRCPKALVRFSSAEGAGTHCEMPLQ